MPEWLITVLLSALGSVLGTAAFVVCKWILKRAFFERLDWRWAIVAAGVSFALTGAGLLIYQQTNKSGYPAQASQVPHQNATPTFTPPSNSDNPDPSRANPEDRRPTPVQTPKPTLLPTSTPTPTSTLTPIATLDPTPTPIPTPDATAMPIPIPLSPPAPTLALSPTIRPDRAIISVVVDRNPHSTKPLQVQALSTLVTGTDGLSVEVHNAVCNNTEHITTKEWIQLHCGYDEEEQRQTVLESIQVWHESVGYLRCEAGGIPNSVTMEFQCFAE